MRRTLLVALLLLAGCSNGKTAAPAVTVPTPVTPSSATGSPATSPSTLPPPSAPASPPVPKLGTAQLLKKNGTNARLTVFAYRQPTAANATRPQSPGTEWASADVQVCLDAIGADFDSITVNRKPWSLIYADGTVATPSSITYQQFDTPEYPVAERTLKVGRCVRGWVTFTAPAGQRATMVEYQSAVSSEDVFDWAAS